MSFKWQVKFIFNSISRNKLASFSGISGIFLLLFLISFFFYLSGFLNFLTFKVSKMANLSIFFKENVSENKILGIKDQLSKLPEVKSVVYISKDEALKDFSKKYSQNKEIIDVLKELGENPFLASLNITCPKREDLDKVLNYLNKEGFSDLIDHNNLIETKSIFKKIESFKKNLKKFQYSTIGFFFFLAVLIFFNVMNLIIERKKEEIKKLKKLGATNWFFIRIFSCQAIIYSLVGFLISILLIAVLSFSFGDKLANYFSGFNLSIFFCQNFKTLSLILFLSSIILGVISTLLALKRYLK